MSPRLIDDEIEAAGLRIHERPGPAILCNSRAVEFDAAIVGAVEPRRVQQVCPTMRVIRDKVVAERSAVNRVSGKLAQDIGYRVPE